MALNLVLVGYLIAVGLLYLILASIGFSLLGLLLAWALVLLLGAMDPRVPIPFPLKRIVDENPPVSFIAASPVALLAAFLALALGGGPRAEGSSNLLQLFSILATYSFLLLVFGILLQILWPQLRSLKAPASVVRYSKENPGALFIVGFMVLLVAAAAALISGLSSLANEIAIYSFYALMIGVGIQLVQLIRKGPEEEAELAVKEPKSEQDDQ